VGINGKKGITENMKHVHVVRNEITPSLQLVVIKTEESRCTQY